VTCRDVTEFFDEHLEGDLHPRTRAAFVAHLAKCSDCQAYLASYVTTIRIAKEACKADGSELAEVPDELVEASSRPAGTAAGRQPRGDGVAGAEGAAGDGCRPIMAGIEVMDRCNIGLPALRLRRQQPFPQPLASVAFTRREGDGAPLSDLSRQRTPVAG